MDPSAGFTSWEITFTKNTHYKAVIENNYNLTVRILVNDTLTPGKWIILWDHKYESGIPVEEGVYILKHYIDNSLAGTFEILIINK